MLFYNYLFGVLIITALSTFAQDNSQLMDAIKENNLANVMYACRIEKATEQYTDSLIKALTYLASVQPKKEYSLENIIDKDCLAPAKIFDPAVLILLISSVMPSPTNIVIKNNQSQQEDSRSSQTNLDHASIQTPNYMSRLSLGGLFCQLTYNYYQCTKTKQETSTHIRLFLQQELTNNN